MIVEIEEAHPSCKSTLDYNERKVARGTAELVAFCNIEDTSRKAVYELFERYEKTRYPIKRLSFHASVNPSDKDECSEEQVIGFIAEMMDYMGYGDTPYLVYRHFDIDRIHYHIASVRVDGDGRKIECLYEKKRVTAFMKTVADKYSFSMAEAGQGVKSRRNIRSEYETSRRVVFDPKGHDTTGQLARVFEYALQYDFDGFEQLACVLKDLGVGAVSHANDDGLEIELQGLDEKGRPCTVPFPESVLGVPLYSKCMEASVANKQRHHVRRREKDRIKGLVSGAFRYSKSKSHFKNILRNKGVTVHESLTTDGNIFGLTLVDHCTRTVFKASEMPEVISVAMMQQAVDSGHWRAFDKGDKPENYIQTSREEAQRAAQVLRNINAGVITTALRPVGQPKGNSWSGKHKKSEEELEEEYQIGRTGSLNFSFEDRSLEDHLV